MLKYNSQGTYDINDYFLKYKNQNLVYDTLQSALVSIRVKPRTQFNDLQLKINPSDIIGYGKRTGKYLSYNHQLNGYLYCKNNPLRYTDPEGRLIEWILRGVWPSNIPDPTNPLDWPEFYKGLKAEWEDYIIPSLNQIRHEFNLMYLDHFGVKHCLYF